MTCTECGAEMLPLATSVFCPNDCDRIVEVEIDPEKTPDFRIGSSRTMVSTSYVDEADTAHGKVDWGDFLDFADLDDDEGAD